MAAIIGLVGLCGISLLLFLWCRSFLNSWDKKREKDNERETFYDERQIAAHGKANAFTVAVGTGYFLVASLVVWGWEEGYIAHIISPSTLMFAGMWLMLVSYSLCCLLTDSAVPLGNYSFPTGGYLVGGGLMVLAEVWASFFVDMDSGGWKRLIVGFSFLAMGVIHRIAYSRSKRESE